MSKAFTILSGDRPKIHISVKPISSFKQGIIAILESKIIKLLAI
jgi:hypothetical protein